MPQQNSNKSNISSIMERNALLPGTVSEFLCAETIRDKHTDDAAACLVKDDNTCIKIRVGEPHSGIHMQPA